MKIGFFGDSYCAVNNHDAYETYIHKLKIRYSAEIVNLGIPGSSIYDNIFLQFDNFAIKNELPDVCVFTWTGHHRLFNREVRNITIRSENPLHRDYFKYLYDEEQASLQAYSVLNYFDANVLTKYKNIKFIHLFCFTNIFNFLHEQKEFTFDNGITLTPFLYDVSKIPPNEYIVMRKNVHQPNHIIGDAKNNFISSIISSAIDEYESGKTMNFQYK